jgi:hypothetical protein
MNNPEPKLDNQDENNLNKFKRFLEIIRGKVDVRNRLDAILNPTKMETSSRLSEDQIDFVVSANWFAKMWPDLYTPLKDYAEELMPATISLNGKGREEAIKFVGAIEQSNLYRAMLGSVGDGEGKRKGRFGRKEKEQSD